MVHDVELTDKKIQKVRDFLLTLQQRICQSLEQQEKSEGGLAKFTIDDWQREEGGGGRSCVMADGKVIEKAGVMFSHIQINNLPASATARHPEIAGRKAQALGVSLVVHPKKSSCTNQSCECTIIYCRKRRRTADLVVWWRF